MRISGGMGLCPEALGIMVLAIGLHRIALRLGLIVSLSVGLATALIGIGIRLARSWIALVKFGSLGSRLTGGVLVLLSHMVSPEGHATWCGMRRAHRY
jgi:hypothetical protein